MTIDPRVGFYLNIIAGVLTGLLGAAALFTSVIGTDLTTKLLAGMGIALIVINAVLHAIPSKPGAANEFPLGPKANP